MADILSRKELKEMDKNWNDLMRHWENRRGFDQKEKARINNIMVAEKSRYSYR